MFNIRRDRIKTWFILCYACRSLGLKQPVNRLLVQVTVSSICNKT
jgi:hypothetical protein